VPVSVVTVREEVAPTVERLTEVGESAHVGTSTAPAGPVTAQVNATLPVNPLTGVAVKVVAGMVAPAVAPSFASPVSVKLGGGATAETTNGSVAVCVILPEIPVTTTL
jgi:hypothetical protein